MCVLIIISTLTKPVRFWAFVDMEIQCQRGEERKRKKEGERERKREKVRKL